MLKQKFNSNFQTRNKTKLCDSKKKNTRPKNMTRLWCKIVVNIGVEQTKKNEGSYFYLYLFGDLVQGNFYVCIK
jgi:hypothetical protein